MEYIKLNFRIEPDNEGYREILIAELATVGFESFAETEDEVEAFIPSITFSRNLIDSDIRFKTIPFTFKYNLEVIPDQNWNEVWEKNYFEPILINDLCLVRAPFHKDFQKVKYEIVIEPKMAFGTGYHETTFLMISEILRIDLKGKKVLDMGCGTGILGILASFKGANSVSCIDIDEWAYRNSMENILNNQITNILVKHGGAELLNDEKYDVIFANIQRNVLLKDMSAYRDSLEMNGQILMSGFYLKDLETIQEQALRLGLNFKGYLEKNEWVVAKFTLK